MKIQDLLKRYAMLPQVGALADTLEKSQRHTQTKSLKNSVKSIFLEGLTCSSAPMLFGALQKKCAAPILFILQDADEAGYFYHDLVQLLGDADVLFFPSSYRRAIKYAQRY